MNNRDCSHGRQIGKCADCDVAALEEENARLRAAITDVIGYNAQAAADRYGDPGKAEEWSCVRRLREALADAQRPKKRICSLGVGCDEEGFCFAAFHDAPEKCGNQRSRRNNMAQLTRSLAESILRGDGITRWEIEQLCHFYLQHSEQPQAQAEPVRGAFLNTDGGVSLCQAGKENRHSGFSGYLYTQPQRQSEQNRAQAEPVASLCSDRVTVRSSAVDWLKEHYPALCEKSGLCHRIGGTLYTRTFLHEAPLSQPCAAVPDVDALAGFIRAIDGKHITGAGVLAEKIVGWLSRTPPTGGAGQ